MSLKAGEKGKGKKVQLSADFEVKDLAEIKHLFLNFVMVKALKVELNGTVVLDNALAKSDARAINLLLKPNTKELLKVGKNTLSLEVVPDSSSATVSLKTCK